MPEFVYDPAIGSFKDWVLKLTRWRIVDQFRRRQKGIVSERQAAETDRQTSTVDRLADPAGQILEQVWDREWSANLMDAAIERVKRRVDSKQYQIFDLAVLKEWPVSRISHFLKINPGRIYLAKHRVSRLIEQELRALKANPTGRSGSSGAGESAGGSDPSK